MARTLVAKRQSGLTWRGIAEKLVEPSRLLHGDAIRPPRPQARGSQKAGALLNLDEAAAAILKEIREERGAALKLPRQRPADLTPLRDLARIRGVEGPRSNEEFGERDWVWFAFNLHLEIGPFTNRQCVNLACFGAADHSLGTELPR